MRIQCRASYEHLSSQQGGRCGGEEGHQPSVTRLEADRHEGH